MDGVMCPTQPLYLEDTYLFSSEAVVLLSTDVSNKDGTNSIAIVTDRTIFHPQGGGQPADAGTIFCAETGALFNVSAVRKGENGVIAHIGAYAEPTHMILPNSSVLLVISHA